MEKENNKIFVHEKILQKAQEKCELLSEKKVFNFKELSNQLLYFFEFELKGLNKGLYSRYNNNNNSDKGLSTTTIGNAWKCEGKQTDGAIMDLRDLICYYTFKLNWSETLELLKIDEEGEIQRTIEKKEEYKTQKEGTPYISKEILEKKRFSNSIYIELITRKAGIPIDEKNDIIEEIYNSWYKLFCDIREEIKIIPISQLKDVLNPESTQSIAIKILNDILRPHLTEHQAKFRSWLEKAKQNPEYINLTPQELQKKYPEYKSLMKSLKDTNEMLIESAKKLFEIIK
jgi:hypothetical protein